jgi:hypothetical protein
MPSAASPISSNLVSGSARHEQRSKHNLALYAQGEIHALLLFGHCG